MAIEIIPAGIPIKEIFEGYRNDEKGVMGYNDKLNIQPAFQRNFIYDREQQIAVIESVIEGFPLSDIYWGEIDDGTFEIIDGQQRITSICNFLNGDFSIKIDGNTVYGHEEGLDPELREKIYNYKLQVHICKGTHAEKMKWFKVINTAGEKLTNQELRNAVYSGSWVYDAKRYFGTSASQGAKMLSDYCSVKTDRQEVLELVLKWYTDDKEIEEEGKNKDKIDQYMAKHKDNPDAKEIWEYAKEVVKWVKKIFGDKPYKEMKNVQWGFLYNEHKDRKDLKPAEIAKKVKKLLGDREIRKKSGIFEYILTGDERCLHLRVFEESDKRDRYEFQKGICPLCKKEGNKKKYKYEEMEGDHVKKWRDGGVTEPKNLRMLCLKHNRST